MVVTPRQPLADARGSLGGSHDGRISTVNNRLLTRAAR